VLLIAIEESKSGHRAEYKYHQAHCSHKGKLVILSGHANRPLGRTKFGPMSPGTYATYFGLRRRQYVYELDLKDIF